MKNFSTSENLYKTGWEGKNADLHLSAKEVAQKLRDWQGAHPETAEEIEEFDWIREDGKSAVVLHGLPRVIF